MSQVYIECMELIKKVKYSFELKRVKDIIYYYYESYLLDVDEYDNLRCLLIDCSEKIRNRSY